MGGNFDFRDTRSSFASRTSAPSPLDGGTAPVAAIIVSGDGPDNRAFAMPFKGRRRDSEDRRTGVSKVDVWRGAPVLDQRAHLEDAAQA